MHTVTLIVIQNAFISFSQQKSLSNYFLYSIFVLKKYFTNQKKQHHRHCRRSSTYFFLSPSLFYISFQKAERESPSLLLFPKKKENVHFVLGSFSLFDICMNHHFIVGLITQSLR